MYLLLQQLEYSWRQDLPAVEEISVILHNYTRSWQHLPAGMLFSPHGSSLAHGLPIHNHIILFCSAQVITLERSLFNPAPELIQYS